MEEYQKVNIVSLLEEMKENIFWMLSWWGGRTRSLDIENISKV